MAKVKSQKSKVESFDLRPALSALYPSTCDLRLVTGKKGGAFSLIELIIIMMVVSILATVVIIKFTGVDSQSNRVAANELRSHLTYIRNMAMSRERTTWVQFNIAANNYKVFMAVSNWNGTYQSAKDPVTQKDWTVDLSSKFSGVALQNVTINGNNTNLYFSETNGMPFGTGGTGNPLTTNGVITFKSGLKVTVAPITGYAGLE